jgi:predicted membrane channel-forming protein YqfA (hemolysin III family)
MPGETNGPHHEDSFELSPETTIINPEQQEFCHKPFIGSIEDAEKVDEWLVYNRHIKKGYRINYKCYKTITKSVVQCHNETTNIWSHLLGAIFFTILLCMVLRSPDTRIALSWASRQYLGGPIVVGGSDTTDSILYKISHITHETCVRNYRVPSFENLSVIKIIEEMRNLEVNFRLNLTQTPEAPLKQFS